MASGRLSSQSSWSSATVGARGHRRPPKPSQTHSWKETWLGGYEARLGTRKNSIKRNFSLAVVLNRDNFAPRGDLATSEDIFDGHTWGKCS